MAQQLPAGHGAGAETWRWSCAGRVLEVGAHGGTRDTWDVWDTWGSGFLARPQVLGLVWYFWKAPPNPPAPEGQEA